MYNVHYVLSQSFIKHAVLFKFLFDNVYVYYVATCMSMSCV